MKYTLLDLTQTILSSTGGDEVNSIDDTVESSQIAKIIRTVYFDIISRVNIPEQYTVFQLEASLDPTQPVIMTLPSTMQNASWIKYDWATVADTDIRMEQVEALDLNEFLSRMYNLRESATNVETFTKTIGSNNITFLYENDRAPSYWTSYDDGTVIFDSYDAAVDSTLQKSKSLAYGKKVVPWTMTDTFIPDLDDNQFSLLLNESKSLAFAETKQTPHQLADRNAHRGWNRIQKQKMKLPTSSDFDSLPNFSRR